MQNSPDEIESTSSIHTVLGAGQIGIALASHLAAAGHRVRLVRLVRRGPARTALPGVTWLRGNVLDPDFADEACRGACSVYNCTNPADYHRWEEVLPPLARAVREAAIRAGARLVVLDNLYMVGRPECAPFDEHHPLRPCSEKGRLRARMVEELRAAERRGDLRVATGRASDFFGPETPNAVIFHPRFFRRLAAGRPIEVMGDPEQPHSYSYTPDVARSLAILGTRHEAVGRTWHLPVAAQCSTRELVERFAAIARRPVRLRRIPTWALMAVGRFVPLVHAIAEMTYQWELPYLADDSAFCRAFGVGPTPLDDAISATLRAHGVIRAEKC